MTAAGAFLGVDWSFGERRWSARAVDDRLALLLAQRLDQPEIIGRILAGRGIAPEAVERFLSPSLRADLPDPSSLMDMDVAVERIVAAIERGETIAVFGDYDVDGATSGALLARYFSAVGVRHVTYIPDRMTEGYGPNLPALKRLQDRGASLVITVDCGTTAFEALTGAHACGLDIVVVDHHVAEPTVPPCAALINPNRLDDTSGCGQLAAVGVTFLLVVALNRALRRAGFFTARAEPDLMAYLDLVALGTICDVVPLTGLNRALVTQGLKVLARRNNVGLRALADVAGVQERPGAYHAGFLLGPRVNAGGRVGQSDLGIRLLTTLDPDEALEIARTLDRHNAERRAIESMVLEAAVDIVEAASGTVAAIAAGRGWHPGVIGIVASRLRERYNRPAFVISLENGFGKGSARSIPGVDLGALVTAAKQAGLLVNGGGHRMAAGFTLEEARLHAFRDFVAGRLSAEGEAEMVPVLGLDGALAVGAATLEMTTVLDRAGPFGAGNPEPRMAFPAVKLVRAAPVGENHLSCVFSGADGGRLEGISFRSLDTGLGRALLAHVGRPIHVAGRLRCDSWQGREKIKLHIDDAAAAT